MAAGQGNRNKGSKPARPLNAEQLAAGRKLGTAATVKAALEHAAFLTVFAEAARNMGHEPEEVRTMLVGKALSKALSGKGDNAMLTFCLDHLFGKPKQPIEVTGEGGGPVRIEQTVMSRDQARAWRDIVLNRN